jgi:hypothetical protein
MPTTDKKLLLLLLLHHHQQQQFLHPKRPAVLYGTTRNVSSMIGIQIMGISHPQRQFAYRPNGQFIVWK